MVACPGGATAVDFPKVRGTKSPFRSQLLAAWERTSPAVLSLLPGLYVEGLSTRAVERVFQPLMEGAGLSRSSVSRANEEIKAGFDLWRKRSLAGEEVIYLFLDGYYQGVRFGTREKEAILVAHGIREDGSRVLLGVYLGGRESTESWKEVLHDLVGRGLRQPLLLISDGNPGLIRAVKDIWPMVPRQRCVQHRLRNILARVPVKSQEAVRRALNRIFGSSGECVLAVEWKWTCLSHLKLWKKTSERRATHVHKPIVPRLWDSRLRLQEHGVCLRSGGLPDRACTGGLAMPRVRARECDL